MTVNLIYKALKIETKKDNIFKELKNINKGVQSKVLINIKTIILFYLNQNMINIINKYSMRLMIACKIIFVNQSVMDNQKEIF